MVTKRLYIKEDITDWRDDAMRQETIVSSPDEVRKALAEGKTTNHVAKAAVVSREIGTAPPDLIRANKLLLMAGAAEDISRMARELREIEIGDKTYSVPGMVGKSGRPPGTKNENGDGDDEQPGPSYVDVQDPEAMDRAIKYLTNTVPGHIWNRLAIIASHGGDVDGVVSDLKKSVDAMVARLD